MVFINAPYAILELFLLFLQETLPVCITFVYASANYFWGTAKTNKFLYLKSVIFQAVMVLVDYHGLRWSESVGQVGGEVKL